MATSHRAGFHKYHTVYRIRGSRQVRCLYISGAPFIQMGRSRTRCPECGAEVTPARRRR